MSQTPTHYHSLVTTQKAHGAAVGPDKTHRSAAAFPPLRRSSFIRARAYTLIEILIVASIVVLMLGMALPVFRVITGSRSEAGASNIIASMMGRARTDAIGLQQTLGVAILYNPNSQLTYLAEVEFADCQPWYVQGQVIAPYAYFRANYNGVNYYFINNTSYPSLPLPAPPIGGPPSAPPGTIGVGGPPLDIRPNTDLVPLPAGIGVQTISNCTFSGEQRTSDGYLNFGVILFDGYGRITSQNYGVSQYSKLGTSGGLGRDYPGPGIGNNGQFGVPSQFGLVVFQREAFVSQGFNPIDHAYDNTVPYDQTQENWLDQNATPLLLNRYTGNLIKAE